MLRLRAERERPFVDAVEAERVAREVGAAARKVTRLGKLWTYAGDDTVLLDDARICEAAKCARFSVPLVAIPGTSRCGVFVSGRARQGGAVVRLTVDLVQPAFVEDVETLLRMFTDVIVAMDPDRAALGARSLVDAGCGWAVFTPQRPERPVGARIIPLPRRGAIVLAYEDIRADGDGARSDAQAVQEALGRSRRSPPFVETHPDEQGDAVLEGTVELRDAVLGPALPFSSAAPAGPPPASSGDARRAIRAPTGTEDVDIAKIREALLPFVGARAAARPVGTAGPAELSLESYALLRASLTIHGEEDAATLTQFGITSPDEKRAIQGRFAAIFRSDPPVQERFLALVKRLAESMPRSGLRPEGAAPDPEPDLDATAEIGATAVSVRRRPFQSTAPLPTPSQPPEPESKKRGS